jgi:hypothetical protein
MAKPAVPVVLLLSLLCGLASHAVDAQYYWSPATATFYGGSDGSGTMGLFLIFLHFKTFVFKIKAAHCRPMV